MKQSLVHFLKTNAKPLIGMAVGCLLGYLYWLNWGMEWGTYPLSAECWTNCVYGALLGGFTGSLLSKQRIHKQNKELEQ